MDYKSHVKIAFSPDENQVAVWSDSLITLWDINNPENGLSFDPWSTERHVFNGRVAFQTSDHGVICAELLRDNHVFVCLFSARFLWISRPQNTRKYSWHPMA